MTARCFQKSLRSRLQAAVCRAIAVREQARSHVPRDPRSKPRQYLLFEYGEIISITDIDDSKAKSRYWRHQLTCTPSLIVRTIGSKYSSSYPKLAVPLKAKGGFFSSMSSMLRMRADSTIPSGLAFKLYPSCRANVSSEAICLCGTESISRRLFE